MSDQPDLLLFPLEIVVFCALAFGIFKLKKRFPELLFPCQGVTLFLPPDAEDLKESKDKKVKTLVQIKTMPSQAQHFQQVPFASDMEITMLFIYMLFAQFAVVEVMKLIGSLLGYYVIESGMLFYFDGIIVLMIIRNLYRAATIGGYDSQQTKMSIVVCIITVVIVTFVNLGFKDFLNINIKHEFQRQAVHFEIVLRTLLQPGIWSFMGQFGDLFVIVLALGVAFIIFCILPILIRFGNCFTELKNKLTTKEAQPKLFYLIAAQLIAHLFYIALYVKSFRIEYAFHLQFLAIALIAALQILTYTHEMDKHMAKGCDWIMILKDQPEQKEYVTRRVEGLLRGFVVVAFQLLSKIAIPVLLFMILLFRNSQIPSRFNHLPANYEQNEMYCVKPDIMIMDYLFDTQDDPIEDATLDPQKIIMKRVTKYGLFSKSFIYTLIEFILFNYYLMSFVLAVFYIFFLSKTQAVKYQKKKKQ